MVTLSTESIREGESLRGGFSAAQLKLVGLSYPLRHGWRERLVGLRIPKEDYERFVALKDKHLTPQRIAKWRAKKERQSLFERPQPELPMPIPLTREQALVVDRRGRALVAGGVPRTITCQRASCLYPACLCGLPSPQIR